MSDIEKALLFHLGGKEISSIKYNGVELNIIFKDGEDLSITASRDAELYVTLNIVDAYDLATALKS